MLTGHTKLSAIDSAACPPELVANKAMWKQGTSTTKMQADRLAQIWREKEICKDMSGIEPAWLALMARARWSNRQIDKGCMRAEGKDEAPSASWEPKCLSASFSSTNHTRH